MKYIGLHNLTRGVQILFFFSSRRRHTRWNCDWSSGRVLFRSLTLLALVLAIGLVVDDAIVVVENIQRRIDEGEPPIVAAQRGARQVFFAVVATTVVLISEIGRASCRERGEITRGAVT